MCVCYFPYSFPCNLLSLFALQFTFRYFLIELLMFCMFFNYISQKLLPNQVRLLLKRATIHCITSSIFLILFFLSKNVYPQQEKINWIEYTHQPENQPVKFISATSTDNFWVEDRNGSLFHFFNGKWEKYSLPIKSIFHSYHFHSLSNDIFLIGVIDKNYHTHFLKFEKGIFFKYEFVTQKPMEGFIASPNGDIFVYGDWGLLASFLNGSWKLLHPPIRNHILTSVFYDGKIYFGTRAEGIFSYDFKDFIIHKTEKGGKSDIIAIQMRDKNLYALNNYNETYIFHSDSFKITDKIQPENFDKIKLAKFGFYEIKRRVFLNNKNNYAFPIDYDFFDFIEVNEDVILLSLNDGKIIYSKKQKENFFSRMDYIFQTEGVEKTNSIGAAFIHFDSDLLPDLFVLNSNKEFSSKLYKNNFHSPFSDLSVNLNSINNSNYFLYGFGDINNDYSPDFIGISTVNGHNIISVSQGANGFKFSKEIDIYSTTTSAIRNLRQFDINKDGRNDLLFNKYLDSERSKGFVQLYKNDNINGKLKRDTSLNQISSSWNLQTINADFNNDGLDDIFIITRWQKNILLINKDGNYSDEYKFRFPKEDLKNSNSGIAFDYDNDGDLDILISTDEQIIHFYENNGSGYFKNITEQKFTFHRAFNSSTILNTFINSGDFNNDGFTDLLINITQKGTGKNYLLINDSAKAFIDLSLTMNIISPEVNGTSIADIDNDGDLDIYGYRYGKNVFWINNLDDNNYLKIFLKGVISNSDAIGTKIWIYKSGHLNDKNYLFGYKQSGSDISGINSYNDVILHFGLSNNNRYDIRVLFPSGKEIILKGINASQILTIEEMEGLLAVVYLLPSNILRLVGRAEIQIYFLVILLGMFFLFAGVKYGVSAYGWDIKITLMLTAVNLSIFWLLILLTYDDEDLHKYIIPPAVVVIGIFLPNLIYYYIKRREQKNELLDEQYDKLFQLLFNFSHGELALKNLNGLQLFCQNVSALKNIEPDFIEQFENRKDRMFQMTLPLIDKILHLANSIELDSTITAETEKETSFIKTNLPQITADHFITSVELIKELGISFSRLKLCLIKLKNIVFAKYSSSPTEVINAVIDELNPLMKEEMININKYKSDDEYKNVLIRNYELADIIDNSIRNSINALKDSSQKEIEINVNKKPPKIIIEIKDKGIGIREDDFEKIFEHGYSTFGGTGHGLFSARKILEKYGGRIFVSKSNPNQQTIFTIELNEGATNETYDFIN